MKRVFSFCVAIFFFSNIYAQFEPGTKTVGFGEIGVVATPNNYGSAYFQNPALLISETHQLDVFLNYNPHPTSLIGVNSTSGGAMFNFGKNAIGIGVHYWNIERDLGHSRYTTIPLVYARSLYKTDQAGISIGGNVNIEKHDVTLLNPYQATNFSGGLGLHGYQKVKLTKQQALRFQMGVSVNDVFGDNNQATYQRNRISQVRIGGLAAWEHEMEANQLSINMAYQLDQPLQLSNSNYTKARAQKIGIEARYGIEKWTTSLALRGGLRWQTLENENFYQYTTFGGSINVHGFYLDFAILPEKAEGFADAQLGIGYQKTLN